MQLSRIAIIGSINRDIIVTERGISHESLGGILYNLLALAELGQNVLNLYPITFIGSDREKNLLHMLCCRKGISLEGISALSGNTNTNRLVYINDNERRETAQFCTPAITFEMIAPYLNCDILLFNFIAGYDVSLQTLKTVRAKTHATLFMDVHSLVLEQTTTGVRTFHSVRNWRQWAAQIDILQMNTRELLFFTGCTKHAKENDETTVRTLISEIVQSGPRFVLITAGNRGIYLGTRKRIFFFPQRYTAPVADSTGCGDIFTAAFLARLLVSGDPFIACDYANTLAGLATHTEGIKKCFALKHFSPLYSVPYPPHSPIETTFRNYSRSGSCASP